MAQQLTFLKEGLPHSLYIFLFHYSSKKREHSYSKLKRKDVLVQHLSEYVSDEVSAEVSAEVSDQVSVRPSIGRTKCQTKIAFLLSERL